jgi:ribosome-binding factor A
MNETRKARLASVIQEELSLLIRQLKDPRVPLITVTRVEVTDDGGQATIFVTLLGNLDGGPDMDRCIEGLTSSAGFLRRGISKVLTIKHIPTLIFREDKGLSNATRVFELLGEIDKVDKEAGMKSTLGTRNEDTPKESSEKERK